MKVYIVVVYPNMYDQDMAIEKVFSNYQSAENWIANHDEGFHYDIEEYEVQE